MISATFNGSDERATQLLRSRGPRIIEALRQKMTGLMFLLQAHIVGEKLSGQVLQHRSGKLAGSIRPLPVTEDGAQIVGQVVGGGGPAFYGRVQEYGGRGSYVIVPVNKQALAFMLNGKQVIVKSVLHPPLSERSFMRTSLKEMQDQIREELQIAANEGLNAA